MEGFNKKDFSSMGTEAVLELFDSSIKGITSDEAEKRIDKFGKNVFGAGNRLSKLQILADQFKSLLIIILAIAGAATLAIGDVKDSLFIFGAMVVNVIMGFYQENKAETALASLRSYVKYRARVIREGVEKEIDAESIVPGDIVKVFSGTRVPADLRILQSNALSVDESILTGESLPVSNKGNDPISLGMPISDQLSMLFAGTLISEGTAIAVVVRTGAETEIGRIAEAVAEKSRTKTPLQKEIAKFSALAAIILFIMVGIVVVIGLAQGYSTMEMFLIGIAMAVSAVPEGLPIALTVILAIGVEKLAKRKGVIRKLIAAEALGGVTTILTDKTGTLTKAKMELSKVISDFSEDDVIRRALLNADAIVQNPESDPEDWIIAGRPLEEAIVREAGKRGIIKESLKEEIKILSEEPFNSEKKFSRVDFDSGKGRESAILGAPEAVIEFSSLTNKEKKKILLQVEELAYSGYRVLGLTSGRDFMGLLAFNDPVREGVKKAIEKISASGIRTVIVTGDHKGTAVSVARQIGLNPADDNVYTHADISNIGEKELMEIARKAVIFARVTPEDKVRIARAFKGIGEVIAMTGDGVNDAPALKEADVGVAVGSGTDVAQGAADLVILDDNFETIVKAVSGGRRIIENIKKTVVYLLSDSLDELMIIGGSIAFGLAIPLNALQILYVNIFSDSFPAIAFAFEDGGDYISAGTTPKKGVFSDKYVRFLILVIGVLASASLFAAYYIFLRLGYDENLVKTFIFGSFSVYTLFLVFSLKNFKKNIFTYSLFDNKYLIGGFAVGIALTFIAIYNPFISGFLGTIPLPFGWALAVIAFALLNVGFVEVGKWFVHYFSKKG
ncbi:MAG: cation-transporting P-type ATPase [Candidatus Colwellbacteria bacterium]|nr:cation-transporting P-type ATPase [Candidatus Colwellbacteria bacterium]